MAGYREYLGDSVYADFDGWNIVLTTDNGLGPSNEIFLEPDVIVSLNSYVENLNERIRNERDSKKINE